MSNLPGTEASVLVVDDDRVLRQIMMEAVEQAGARVEVACDGADAVEKLTASPFDVLITDLNMPRMDGLDLLRHVRQHYPHILSVLVTGFGSLESAIEAIRLGAYDYLQKPFKIEELELTVRNAIENVRITKEKAVLVDQMAKLHNRLRALTSQRTPECEVYDASGRLVSGPASTDPGGQTYALLEKPDGNPNRALAALEVLRALWREGQITDSDLERFRKVILGRISVEAS